ncbi:MAG: hypothetical protein U9N55_06695 [candidate division Zixibacteria bacterium]|nr:hypothetical protein [candidate division Zixibacteria bacterium]
MLLDYEKLEDFLDKYFGSPHAREARMVGINRLYDSGYFDIVRFFGEDKINPDKVEIHSLPGRYELSDQKIKEFSGKIESQLRKQGRLYDGPDAMRLKAVNLTDSPYYISIQACNYGIFAGCCFGLDQPDQLFDSNGSTLREYYKQITLSTNLETHPLAMCLGVCGMVVVDKNGDEETNDIQQKRRYLLLVHRSKHLASLEDTIGVSAAGSVDFTTSCQTLSELSKRSLSQEIEEELGLAPNEFTVEPLAYAREIFRGEKPQLFCLIKTPLSVEELTHKLQNPQQQSEFDSFEFIPMSDDLIGTLRQMEVNHEVMMNSLLLEEYFTVS